MQVTAVITLHDGTRVTFDELSTGVTKRFGIRFTRMDTETSSQIVDEFNLLLNADDAAEFQRALSFIGVIE